MTSKDSVFNRLVQTISDGVQRDWHDLGMSPDSFPEIAEKNLNAAVPGAQVESQDVVDWVMNCGILPYQPRMDTTFGEPPVTVFWHESFRIDALFWVDGSTAIHGHGFNGAFRVLAGRSLHVKFAFQEQYNISPHFRLGSTSLESFELLAPGDVRPIHMGNALIHDLTHLERPCITLVVRTNEASGDRQELVLFPPSIAIDPSEYNPLRVRELQLLDMQLKTDPEQALVNACQLVTSDLHTAFEVALRAASHGLEDHRLQRIFSDTRDLYGGLADTFPKVILQERKRVRASALRFRITDPQLRYFVAALFYAPDIATLENFMQVECQTDDVRADIDSNLCELCDYLFEGDLDSSLCFQILKVSLQNSAVEQALGALHSGIDLRAVSMPIGDFKTIYGAIRNNPLFEALVNHGVE